MANPKGNPATLKHFTPGTSPNPGGKSVGARNRVQGKFLNALADDFDKNGKQAIVEMREKDPSGYVRVIASLMPKEIEASRPMAEMTDEELAAAIALVQSTISASPGGTGDE